MSSSPLAPSRPSIAAGVLSTVWAVFAVLLWVILAKDHPVVPPWLFVPGLAVTLLFAAGLLSSRRWDGVWRRAFVSTVPVPGWLWLATALFGVAAVGVSAFGPVSLTGLPWLGAFAVGASYAAAVASGRAGLRNVIRTPAWLVLAAAATLTLVVGVGAVLDRGTVVTAVFVLALLLVTFHVAFILPLTLYQCAREPDDADADSYPPVSVLIPAYDEEGVVGGCIESVLATEYPAEKLEVVVIDDGSTDGTFEEAAQYRDSGVRVLQRTNGGKHAALNMGLECTSAPVVVTVDADSRPVPTAIPKMVTQLLDDPSLGALSPSVLATNDSTALTGLQRIEYAISNTNRRAYSIFGAVPVVPGCLGVYRREALEDVWGYDADTITEDFDVTVQLLKHGWRVRHGTGVVATIVPGGWRALWRQRLRWYRGGLETLRKHRDVLVSPRYRYLHALTLPTRLVSQFFGPIASFVILGAVVWGFVTGPSTYFLVLVGLFFLLTVLMGLFSVVLEGEPLSAVVYAPLLFVGYKHFVDCTVGVGTIRAFVADRRW